MNTNIEPYDESHRSRWINHWVNRKQIRDIAIADAATELIACDLFKCSFTAIGDIVRKHEWNYNANLHGANTVYLITMALKDLSWTTCLQYIQKQKKYQAIYDCVIEEWMALLEQELIAKYGNPLNITED